MGSAPYVYVVDYEYDVQAALEKLRGRVFDSGEFAGAEQNPATPEEALELAREEGTGSILDILSISDQPQLCAAAPLDAEELQELFGTDRPSADMVRENGEFWERIDRGTARYVVIYDGGTPSKLLFAGYSFDVGLPPASAEEEVMASNPAAEDTYAGLAKPLKDELRASYKEVAARRAAVDFAKEKFAVAWSVAKRLVGEAGIVLEGRPGLEGLGEAMDKRFDQMLRGPGEKIILARVVKPLFHECLPQFKWLRDRDSMLQLSKPLEGELSTTLYVDKNCAHRVGKMFTIALGVHADSGPYAVGWHYSDIAYLWYGPGSQFVWRYETSQELDVILRDIAQLVADIVPAFEQGVREAML